MHVNNTIEKCSFRQSMFYCELNYRNTQPHLNVEVRKQPQLVKSECLCVTFLMFICQGRNQARPLEDKIISYIYNIDYLSVLYKCSSGTALSLSGNPFQVWCQLAPLTHPGGVTGSYTEQVSSSACWPRKPAKPLLILSLQISSYL